MKKDEVKAGQLYATLDGTVLRCIDTGEGRFPRIGKFSVLYPFKGQLRMLKPSQLARALSERETEEFSKAGG